MAYVIKPKENAAVVQDLMNAARGGIYWSKQNVRWKVLCATRNKFISEELSKLGFTVQEFQQLETCVRDKHLVILEETFSNDFFAYSRDGGGVQTAVGDKEDWIKLGGMAIWHVKLALKTLLRDKQPTGSASIKTPAPPFDAVRDAMREAAESNQAN